jgi:hypothetical protein
MAANFPSSPTEGQVHNVSPGNSFVFLSGVWVPAPVKTALPKNYVVNPSMQISQQNGDVAGTVTGYYPADQWVYARIGATTYDGAARIPLTTLSSGYCLRFFTDAGPP